MNENSDITNENQENSQSQHIEIIEQENKINEEDNLLQQIPKVLPVLPLRDSVVFNSMVVPLYETRDKGVFAIDHAFMQSKFIFLNTQKSFDTEDPDIDDLYEIGTVGLILRMLKLPGGQLKVLIQGVARARRKKIINTLPYLEAEIEVFEEKMVEVGSEEEALMRIAREQSEKILQLRSFPVGDIMNILTQVNEPGKIADLIASNMRLNISAAQKLLECIDGVERLKLVNEHLNHEVEIADIQARIQNTARDGMDKAQKAYFLREQMKAIRMELGESANLDDDLDLLYQQIEKAGLSKEARKEADKQFQRLSAMGQESAEANVIRTYLDWLIELPWKKLSKDMLDIKKAKQILEEDHFGLEKAKDRILEFLSVRKLNPNSKGSILCFVGPPGVGKTSLGRSIARALKRKFQRISLGGMRDEAEIRGHRRTYIGAMPGRIIQSMKQAGSKNPVILLDELDKLGSDFRGDPSSALLEALDPEQNIHFSDHYLNVSFDLSKVLFLCTANNLDGVPAALKDRLEIIQLSGYTEVEKLEIAKKYLIARQLEDSGLDKKNVKFSDACIKKIITKYTREAGLRNLEREIGKICRKIARKIAEEEQSKFSVTDKQLFDYLGTPPFPDENIDEITIPGIAMGLAWTPVGGEVLYVEASLMKGKGKLSLTGKLGETMKESAQAALSYARNHAEELGLEPDFNEKYDFHIHVPAGATPKDGPSAGITITTALISALSNKKVRSDICMTGEISLRGRVLPVGGIKSKMLAAVSKGIYHIIIPKQNINDLDEIPKELLSKITVHSVNNIDEVLKLVFAKESIKKSEK